MEDSNLRLYIWTTPYIYNGSEFFCIATSITIVAHNEQEARARAENHIIKLQKKSDLMQQETLQAFLNYVLHSVPNICSEINETTSVITGGGGQMALSVPLRRF